MRKKGRGAENEPVSLTQNCGRARSLFSLALERIPYTGGLVYHIINEVILNLGALFSRESVKSRHLER